VKLTISIFIIFQPNKLSFGLQMCLGLVYRLPACFVKYPNDLLMTTRIKLSPSAIGKRRANGKISNIFPHSFRDRGKTDCAILGFLRDYFPDEFKSRRES